LRPADAEQIRSCVLAGDRRRIVVSAKPKGRSSPMFMRVATFPPEERVADVPEDVVREQLLGSLVRLPGFGGGYFGLDRRSGTGISVTLWATEDDLQASEEVVAGLARGGDSIPNPGYVETFEVVYNA
jgi:hypothetical protein